MTETTRRWPSVQQIGSSILLALSAVCLAVGVVMAFALMASGGDAVSLGEWITTEVLGLLVYGPMMVATGWPVTIPLVIILGVLLAFGRLRYQRDREPPPAARIVRTVLFGYAAVSALTWAVLLLRARGRS